MPARDFADLLPLHPRDHALLVALSEEPLHGYALMERLPEITDGRISVGPATLYRTLDKLQASGVVEAEEARSSEGSGPPRTPYRLTEWGRSVLEAETERLAGMISRVRMGEAGRSR